MPELTDRIRTTTAALQQILADLDAAAHAADPGYRDRIARELLVPGTIHDFKTAVDDMRHMIWSYMQANERGAGQDVESRLQSVRMQRVTQMLKALEPEITRPSAPSTAETQTFLELIHDIAHTTIDRHQTQ